MNNERAGRARQTSTDRSRRRRERAARAVGPVYLNTDDARALESLTQDAGLPSTELIRRLIRAAHESGMGDRKKQ